MKDQILTSEQHYGACIAEGGRDNFPLEFNEMCMHRFKAAEYERSSDGYSGRGLVPASPDGLLPQFTVRWQVSDFSCDFSLTWHVRLDEETLNELIDYAFHLPMERLPNLCACHLGIRTGERLEHIESYDEGRDILRIFFDGLIEWWRGFMSGIPDDLKQRAFAINVSANDGVSTLG